MLNDKAQRIKLRQYSFSVEETPITRRVTDQVEIPNDISFFTLEAYTVAVSPESDKRKVLGYTLGFDKAAVHSDYLFYVEKVKSRWWLWYDQCPTYAYEEFYENKKELECINSFKTLKEALEFAFVWIKF